MLHEVEAVFSMGVGRGPQTASPNYAKSRERESDLCYFDVSFCFYF
jgi:hypothetical protein